MKHYFFIGIAIFVILSGVYILNMVLTTQSMCLRDYTIHKEFLDNATYGEYRVYIEYHDTECYNLSEYRTQKEILELKKNSFNHNQFIQRTLFDPSVVSSSEFELSSSSVSSS